MILRDIATVYELNEDYLFLIIIVRIIADRKSKDIQGKSRQMSGTVLEYIKKLKCFLLEAL